MSVEIDAGDFLRGLDRLVRDVEQETTNAVEAGLDAFGDEFRQRAKVLSGEYRDSWRVTRVTRSGDQVEGEAGPTVPYARKLERRYGAVVAATEARSPEAAIEDAWRRAIR